MNYVFSTIGYLVLAFILIGINCFISSKMVDVAELKGYDPKQEHIYMFCFFLGILGYLYVLALPDLRLQNLLKSVIEKKYENTSEVIGKKESNSNSKKNVRKSIASEILN